MSENAQFSIGGATIEVRTVAGGEQLSDLFGYHVVGGASATAAASAHDWPGQAATLTLTDGHGGSRAVSGVAADVDTEIQDDGTAIVRVALVPTAYLETLGSDCRYFLDKSVDEIVGEVLAAVPHRFELTRAYRKRAYTVQYRENNLTFARRLLEEEGIYFWFDHEAGSMLVMADDSTGAPELAGGGAVRFHADTGMTATHEVVHGIGGRSQLTPSAFVVRSFDPARPQLDVAGTAGGGALEYYDAPGGGPVDPAEAARQASLGAGAAASGSGVAGQIASARVCPGRIMSVSDHPSDSFNASFFITSCTVSVQQRMRDTGGEGRSFSASFGAIGGGTPFVPPRDTPPGQQAGLQSGTVMGAEEIHPDDLGRVRVRMHWARTGGDGWWLRVAQRGVSDSLQLPRVGWNVLSFNDEGAIDTPSVLSRILDAEHPPPYPLPANKTRVVYRTHTSPVDGLHNEIYFEDKAGEQQMFIHASKNMDLLVKEQKVEAIHHDSARRVDRDHRLTVKTNRSENVRRDQREHIHNDDRLEVGSQNQQTIDGNATITIAGDRKVVGNEAHSITVENRRSLSVGSALIDVSLGDLQGEADIFTQLVGGADIRIAATAMEQDSGAVNLSAVGGLRLRVAKNAHTLDAGRQHIEAIGGLLMQKTNAKYTDLATRATWTSGLGFEAKGKTITVKAEDSIKLICGGSQITLLPDKIEITSTNVDVSKASAIVITTAQVEHN